MLFVPDDPYSLASLVKDTLQFDAKTEMVIYAVRRSDGAKLQWHVPVREFKAHAKREHSDDEEVLSMMLQAAETLEKRLGLED